MTSNPSELNDQQREVCAVTVMRTMLEEDLHKDLGMSQKAAVAPVRIAMTHRGGNYVGSHTAALMEKHSTLHLEYLDMTANQCETALENESVDLAVYTDPVLTASLEYMPLEKDLLIFVIPETSPILNDLELSNNSLSHPGGRSIISLCHRSQKERQTTVRRR